MLFEEFDIFRNFQGENFFKDCSNSLNYLESNLSADVVLRDYQREAIGRLVFYLDGYKSRQLPTHLLFNMATGSGKTVIMASSILHLYKLGYRTFVFFTRLDNIVEKTKTNFMDKSSKKYLFRNDLYIDGNKVEIREILNMADADSSSINLFFATTGMLHSRINTAREDGLTIADLATSNTVFIADEAHNLSASTGKRSGKSNVEEVSSWESTATDLLKANLSNQNVLLEFTATARLEEQYPEFLSKYRDKALFKYDLKSFRRDGYSKEVRTLQFDGSLLDRTLVALLISQYRRKLAAHHGIDMKPVILFKANRVNGSTVGDWKTGTPKITVSSEFKMAFHDLIENLSPEDIDVVRQTKHPLLEKFFLLLDSLSLGSEELVKELQRDFAPQNCLSVDEGQSSVSDLSMLNSLEDRGNPIRAVFATEKLNEGWDVLNLFDIVRLYDTRDSRSNKPGASTVQEAQLVGRGARYYPFDFGAEPRDMRKFDDDSDNPLRILETMYFHSATNPRYIQELEAALIREGILSNSRVERKVEVKPALKETDFWKEELVLSNKIETSSLAGTDLPQAHIDFDNLFSSIDPYQFGFYTSVDKLAFESGEELNGQGSESLGEYVLLKTEKHLVRFVLQRNSRFSLSNLQVFLPNLVSIEDFISNKSFLGQRGLKFRYNTALDFELSAGQKIALVEYYLNHIVPNKAGLSALKVGSRTFHSQRVQDVFSDPKTLSLEGDSPRSERLIEVDLSQKDWFLQNEIWGTSEEKDFVIFLDSVMDALQEKYDNVVLVRNEMYLKLLNFDDGESFYPDFILFLSEKSDGTEKMYQVFIEPKGNQFLDSTNNFANSKEGWKEKFLLELQTLSIVGPDITGKEYVILGLPFFNAGKVNALLKSNFEHDFRSKLL